MWFDTAIVSYRNTLTALSITLVGVSVGISSKPSSFGVHSNLVEIHTMVLCITLFRLSC